jgi:hypothetical protein
MVHPKMLIKGNIDQSIVTAPTIGMNHGIGSDMSSNQPLQRGFGGVNFSSTQVLRELPAFGTVRHNLGINHTVSLEQSKHSRFAICATSSFASDTERTKVRFIDFNGILQRRVLFTHRCDLSTQFKVTSIHRAKRYIRQLRRIGCGKIHGKVTYQLPEFRFTDSRTNVVSVFNSHLSKLSTR